MHPLVIVATSFVLMEPVTALTHRFVMHGVGRALHRSHHRNGSDTFHTDDTHNAVTQNADTQTGDTQTGGTQTGGTQTGDTGAYGTVGLEANDAFPVMFAALVMMGLAVGFNVDGWSFLVPMGIGITAYGVSYALVHDVYIHRRVMVPAVVHRHVPGLQRLAQAHGMHHQGNGAPYGMLLPVTGWRKGSRPSQSPDEA